MAFEFPPGIVLLINRLPRLLLPPASVYLLIRILSTTSITLIPRWLQIALYIISLPGVFSGSIYTNYANERAASAVGAVIPPKVKSKWIGGLDLLVKDAQNFKSGYLGV